jgi:hypothetical protein
MREIHFLIPDVKRPAAFFGTARAAADIRFSRFTGELNILMPFVFV